MASSSGGEASRCVLTSNADRGVYVEAGSSMHFTSDAVNIDSRKERHSIRMERAFSSTLPSSWWGLEDHAEQIWFLHDATWNIWTAVVGSSGHLSSPSSESLIFFVCCKKD
eukprot:2750949-Prymnesium_polylepis.1